MKKEQIGLFVLEAQKNDVREVFIPYIIFLVLIDEEALATGAELYAQYALAYLNQEEF